MDKKLLIIALMLLVLQVMIVTNSYLMWAIKGVTLMFVIPTIFILLTRKKMSDFGFNCYNLKLAAIFICVVIAISTPILFYYSASPDFITYYPIWKGEFDFLAAEPIMLFAMLGTEFFFRGFLLNLALKYVNWKYAIIAQAIPYALLHFGKPIPEFFLSFLAGLVFGYVAYKTKSILATFVSHSTIAFLLDAFIIYS